MIIASNLYWAKSKSIFQTNQKCMWFMDVSQSVIVIFQFFSTRSSKFSFLPSIRTCKEEENVFYNPCLFCFLATLVFCLSRFARKWQLWKIGHRSCWKHFSTKQSKQCKKENEISVCFKDDSSVKDPFSLPGLKQME